MRPAESTSCLTATFERLAGSRLVARFAGIGQIGRVDRLGRPVGVSGPGLEQRILLDLLGDEALDLEVRQREQADRLLQLRRHHQRLGLPEVEAGAERHG